MTETDQKPTIAETMEFMKNLGELMDLLRRSMPKLRELLKLMDKQADGSDGGAWFQVLMKTEDLSEDEILSMLMLCLGTLSKVRVAIKGTAMERELKTLMGMD